MINQERPIVCVSYAGDGCSDKYGATDIHYTQVDTNEYDIDPTVIEFIQNDKFNENPPYLFKPLAYQHTPPPTTNHTPDNKNVHKQSLHTKPMKIEDSHQLKRVQFNDFSQLPEINPKNGAVARQAASSIPNNKDQFYNHGSLNVENQPTDSLDNEAKPFLNYPQTDAPTFIQKNYKQKIVQLESEKTVLLDKINKEKHLREEVVRSYNIAQSILENLSQSTSNPEIINATVKSIHSDKDESYQLKIINQALSKQNEYFAWTIEHILSEKFNNRESNGINQIIEEFDKCIRQLKQQLPPSYKEYFETKSFIAEFKKEFKN